MHLTWTTLCLDEPTSECPWKPSGADFWQAGPSAAGKADIPSFDGRWWSVVATWPDEAAARDAAPQAASVDGSAWHVVLQAASYRGDACLTGGAQPFAGLPAAGKAAGAAAVITLAGFGADQERTGEFFERFAVLGRDVVDAPGNRVALIQAPSEGAVLTFSAWETLRSAVTWAYHQPLHSATVRRQEEHELLATTGFLRCAVLSSSGSLGDRPDPLAGLTGTVTVRETT